MTEPTGERFVPEAMGGQLIEAEHVARYALAARLAHGRRVLDAGCGVGWGTELLLAAGASGAVGFDIDLAAVADARRRVPEAQFVQGDLARLPWADASFDLVTCFEALEHVGEQERTLDELVRVLAPDGLLLVSSPNPRVYPAGNPFHIRELTPEELLEAVGRRLPNLTLWSQHIQIASVLVRKDALPPGVTHEVLGRVVSPLQAGSDPYSMVLAGRGPVPALQPLLTCAPSKQLLDMEAHAVRLGEEREAILAERADLLRQLRDADGAIRGVLDQLSEQQATHKGLEARTARLEQLCETLRREREHTAVLLLESEQQLAAMLGAELPARDGPSQTECDIVEAELRRVVCALEHEVAALRASTSWQVTAPMRAISRLRQRRR